MKSKLNPLMLFVALVFLSSCSTLDIFGGARSHFDRGLALFNQGNYEAAIPYFQQATAEDPNYAEAYLYLGRSYLSLSRWGQAIAPLRTAYRLAPEQMKQEALNFLIDALFAAALNDFKLGEFGTSVERFKEILRLDPASVKAKAELVKTLITYGGKLLSQGLIREAIAVYSEALQWSPNHFDAHLGLANAFFKNGDYVKALQSARDALRINPNHREAQSLFNNLGKR